MALFVGNMPGLDKNFALNLSAYIFSPSGIVPPTLNLLCLL